MISSSTLLLAVVSVVVVAMFVGRHLHTRRLARMKRSKEILDRHDAEHTKHPLGL
jgi:hypothetical protein